MLFSLSVECKSHEAPITAPSEKVCVCLHYSSQTHINTHNIEIRVAIEAFKHGLGWMRTYFALVNVSMAFLGIF